MQSTFRGRAASVPRFACQSARAGQPFPIVEVEGLMQEGISLPFFLSTCMVGKRALARLLLSGLAAHMGLSGFPKFSLLIPAKKDVHMKSAAQPVRSYLPASQSSSTCQHSQLDKLITREHVQELESQVACTRRNPTCSPPD